MKKAVIEFVNFSFQYESQQNPTLEAINLKIYEGEKVLILGASGSGKSTLGYCLNGIIPNRYKGKIGGTAYIGGQDLRQASIFSLSKTVGTLLQDSDAQFVGLSVAEDIAFSLENSNVPREEMDELIIKSAERVGILNQLALLPYYLSGGQKQRVSLAGILHENIDFLLLDEPLAALDPHMCEKMLEIVDSLNKEEGKTVVIIEHRLEEVLFHHLDRIILMDKGRIVADTRPDDLLKGNLLKDYGIREPLFLSAIKKMLGGLKQEENLSRLDTLNLSLYEPPQLRDKEESGVNPEAETLIQIDNLAFGYDPDKPFLFIDHLRIRQGERIALLGENGSGKTTLARLLTGIIQPQKGGIYRLGNPTTIQEIAQVIGYVMQNPNQMLVATTVFEEVALALKLRKAKEYVIEEKVHQVLRVAGLYEKRHWPISALSYGQKKRLSVAIVLALEPRCLILDEPTAGQDYAHYREVMEFIDRLHREQLITIIFITHDMHLAMEYTDRGLIMQDGKVIADDHIFDLLRNDDLMRAASLRKTSIFHLAEKLGVEEKPFINTFIQIEKEAKNG